MSLFFRVSKSIITAQKMTGSCVVTCYIDFFLKKTCCIDKRCTLLGPSFANIEIERPINEVSGPIQNWIVGVI
jgi:hypothetical protein